MRPHLSAPLVLLSLALLAACGRASSSVRAFETATAELQASPAYHVTAVVIAPTPLATAINGTYEIDFERPDRYRTIRIVGSEEVIRTVSVEDDLYSSDDKGSTWEHVVIRDARGAFTVQSLLDMLDNVCEVKPDGSRLRLGIASRMRGCERTLPMSVELNGDVIRSIETEMPTDLGPFSVAAVFDFDRVVQPVRIPEATS